MGATVDHLVKYTQDSTLHGTCVSKVAQVLSPIKEKIKDLDGICDALSVEYLRRKIFRISFPAEAPGDLNIEELRKQQLATLGRQADATKDTMLRDYAMQLNKPFSGENVSLTISPEGGTIAALIYKFKNDWHAVYCMVYLRTMNKSNHTCCAVLYAAGNIEYFDPNIGVFQFENKDEFKAWIGTIWPKMYRTQGYTGLEIVSYITLDDAPLQ